MKTTDQTASQPNRSASPTDAQPRWIFGDRWVPLFLLILTLVTYAPLIRHLGFYWDDWPMLWFDVTQGPAGFAEAFTSDRPFLGYLYQATGAIIGTSPLNWQILTVLFRWLVSWAFWWMLKQLWDDRPDETFWMAVLLTVYSGFKQMPIAYVWGNALIMLFAYILSYGIMLKAVAATEDGRQKNYWVWTALGVLCYTFCTISTEYYTGLDLIRGIILWIFLLRFAAFHGKTLIQKIGKTLWYWLPYLVVLFIFMFWRVFIFKFPSYQPVLVTELQQNPLTALLGLFVRIVEDSYIATWGAWTEFFRFPLPQNLSTLADRLFWIAAFAGFALVFVFSLRYRQPEPEVQNDSRPKRNWTLEAFVLGIAAVVFPGIPYVITSLSPALDFPRERWLSAYMFGSCIFLVALIVWLVRARRRRILILSLFAAMAVGGNLLNSNSFRRDWENQHDFVNQLTTRIPGLQLPAYFLTDFNPLAYETDNSLTGMVNLALTPESTSLTLPVSVGFYDVRFKSSAESLEAGTPIYQGFRSATFQGQASDVIVYFYSPPGCLRILDPAQHATLPIFPESFYQFMQFSHPQKILAEGNDPSYLNEEIFHKAPPENWCMAFQRADLARQNEDWATVAAIGDETLPRFTAGEASEYIPFIEAYAHENRWRDAIPLIGKIHAMNKSLGGSLCPILQKLFVDFLPADETQMDEAAAAIVQTGCSAYNQ